MSKSIAEVDEGDQVRAAARIGARRRDRRWAWGRVGQGALRLAPACLMWMLALWLRPPFLAILAVGSVVQLALDNSDFDLSQYDVARLCLGLSIRCRSLPSARAISTRDACRGRQIFETTGAMECPRSLARF